MKNFVILTAVTMLAATTVLASGSAPPSGSSAPMSSGARGCPTASLEGTIATVDPAKGVFELLVAPDGPRTFYVTSATRYRVPGVKAKVLKEDPLAKLPPSAAAKVRFCKGTQKAVELKVKKEKK